MIFSFGFEFELNTISTAGKSAFPAGYKENNCVESSDLSHLHGELYYYYYYFIILIYLFNSL